MIRMLSKISIAVLLASMMIADLSMVQASEAQANDVQASEAQAENKLGGNFSLTDHDEQPFELSQLEGSVVLLFFGYTSCPDVCPAELGKMSQILRTFESRGDKVKGLFITVDPARDSPQILKDYTAYFSEHLKGLTGSREQINKVVRQYRAKYQITQNETDRITVDHSSTLYVIDKDGNLETMIPFGLSVPHVVNVVEWLLKK
jgi:cytochrome oxidase Cu insertion factor (SCO1/SenC/PrrC family)